MTTSPAFDRDRRRGILVGLAVGDALGAAVEFEMPGTFEPVTGYRAGGPHRLKPGEWTDDTSMALALADAMGEGWCLERQARNYVAWWRQGRFSVTDHCFDIGMTTRAALVRFEQTGNARRSGDTCEGASGNGSIMRLGPVAIRHADWFESNLEQLVTRAVESSLPTHASPQCLSACACLATMLAGLARGVPREEVLSGDWEPWRRVEQIQPFHPAIREVVNGSFRRREPPGITGGGYVVHSLEAALWAFHGAADFREAVLRAVNLGDDADTTGAVCGQLAGACWGESGIPLEWRLGLARQDMVETALSTLLGAAEGTVGLGEKEGVNG